MTQEELLAQLHDIHTPAVTVARPELGFALWPLVVFVLLLSSILVLRYWRRNAWRREARAALKAIAADNDLQRCWSALLQLGAQIARLSGQADSMPDVAYQNPRTVSQQDAAMLYEQLLKKLS